MISTRYALLMAVALLVVTVVQSPGQAPATIDDWVITIGPSGNEYYGEPERQAENPYPSDLLIDVVRSLAPEHVELKSWFLQYDDTYQIRMTAGPERYDYYLALDGTVIEIEFNNDTTGVREKAYALIIKDSKVEVPVNEVPAKALTAIDAVFPEGEIQSTWLASSVVGPRYVIIIGGSVFYARPDGQIQSARLISEGGLEEIYPPDEEPDVMIPRVTAECEELLGEYRDHFNYENQIDRLGRGERKSSFRFVVMGDSRSNDQFWPVIVKHISALDPKPDFVINTGDLVPRGFPSEFRDYLIPGLLELGIPHFTALGNHECGYNRKAIEYRFLYGENSLNYHFDYGGFRFVFIDDVSRANSLEETAQWLDQVLTSTPDSLRLIVTAHKPFGTIDKWAYHGHRLERSKPFTDLLSRHQVDHVFLGHIHAYSTATFNGVNYTVSGGGGASLHDRFGPDGSVHHYIIVDAMPDGALDQKIVRFRKQNGKSDRHE